MLSERSDTAAGFECPRTGVDSKSKREHRRRTNSLTWHRDGTYTLPVRAGLGDESRTRAIQRFLVRRRESLSSTQPTPKKKPYTKPTLTKRKTLRDITAGIVNSK